MGHRDYGSGDRQMVGAIAIARYLITEQMHQLLFRDGTRAGDGT